MSRVRILRYGPVVGEFGWELMSQIPFARHLARDYDDVVIAAPRGHEHLWEFATEYIPVDLIPGTQDSFTGQIVTRPPGEWREPNWGLDTAAERQDFQSPHGRASWAEKAWRSYRTPGLQPCWDVLVAFRPPKLYNGTVYDFKAWPERSCQALVDRLLQANLRVAAIGGADNYAPEGAEDLRCISLEGLCGVMSQSRACVGPSSAPLHLASLCELPHVTWYNQRNMSSRNRYLGAWNPFATTCHFLSPLEPSPGQVFDAISRILVDARVFPH